jgi:predicted RNA-binding Zn-ribbon protein involved in translation (DUF1610 family)
MIEYPMMFREFITRFPDEEHCRAYLFDLRFSGGFICPKCGNSKAWKIGTTLYECSKCGHQTSVIAGTVFQDTRKPLMDWFIAIWWVTTQKNGGKCTGVTAGSWIKEPSNCLDMAA